LIRATRSKIIVGIHKNTCKEHTTRSALLTNPDVRAGPPPQTQNGKEPGVQQCLKRAGKGPREVLCGTHARVLEQKGEIQHGTIDDNEKGGTEVDFAAASPGASPTVTRASDTSTPASAPPIPPAQQESKETLPQVSPPLVRVRRLPRPTPSPGAQSRRTSVASNGSIGVDISTDDVERMASNNAGEGSATSGKTKGIPAESSDDRDRGGSGGCGRVSMWALLIFAMNAIITIALGTSLASPHPVFQHPITPSKRDLLPSRTYT
jgi:hypothetical protein